jgi:uncharacterized protein (TIGR02001 family)
MFADLPPPDPAVEMLVASRGMSKGISQTQGPQLIAKGSLRLGDLQAGAQWKNVSSPSADGEAALFVNGSRKIGTVQLTAGVAYKFQTRVRANTDSTSWEFTGGASRKFGPVTAKVSAIFSPDDLGSARRSLFVEGGPAVQLGKGWTASAAIGHRSRVRGTDYTAFNIGVGKAVRWLQLDLRYYDTNRSDIATAYHSRVVASARLSF